VGAFGWAAPDCRCKTLLGEREREIDGKRDSERESEKDRERKRSREKERKMTERSRERQRGGKHLELTHALQQLLCLPA
jgi:hypothetical protein